MMIDAHGNTLKSHIGIKVPVLLREQAIICEATIELGSSFVKLNFLWGFIVSFSM